MNTFTTQFTTIALPPTPSQAPCKAVERPKRPLTAYNLFFQQERENILRSRGAEHTQGKGHGKIGFTELARLVSNSWKNVDPATKTRYERQASLEKERYNREMKVWKQQQRDQELQAVMAENQFSNQYANLIARQNREIMLLRQREMFRKEQAMRAQLPSNSLYSMMGESFPFETPSSSCHMRPRVVSSPSLLQRPSAVAPREQSNKAWSSSVPRETCDPLLGMIDDVLNDDLDDLFGVEFGTSAPQTVSSCDLNEISDHSSRSIEDDAVDFFLNDIRS